MYACPECGSQHERGRPIAVHWSMVHPDLERPDDLPTSLREYDNPIDCPECGTATEGTTGLTTHWSRAHEGEVPIDNSRSKETREKISESLEGNTGPWAEAEPEEMPMYGKTHSEETKRKMSESQKGKTITKEQREEISKTLRGKAGFFPPKEDYPEDWEWLKKEIRERDGWRCVRCRIPEVALPRKLSVHHINRDKSDSDWSNLVSLCNSCHAKSEVNPFFLSR